MNDWKIIIILGSDKKFQKNKCLTEVKKNYSLLLMLLLIFSISTFGILYFCGFKEKNLGHSFSIVSGNSSTRYSYDLSKANDNYELPAILNEISGLTDLNLQEIGCVQDEKGVIFVYDLQKKEIKREIDIVPEGDFEGITLVGDTMYLLRSDGNLLEIKNYLHSSRSVTTYPLDLRSNDNEGLCYDEKNRRLLIASKGKIGKGPEFKDIRVINVFDLKTKAIVPDQIIELSLESIETFARKMNINLPLRKKKNGGFISALRFMPSAIAVHPLTDNLYLLSAVDNMLLVIDFEGSIIHVESLLPSLHSKPEGITFLRNGDLLISNEADGSNASILKYNLLRQK